MPNVDNSPIVVPGIVESAIALGWDIMHRCRADIDAAESPGWAPVNIGSGDLGVAMAYTAADHLDPDGGWDLLAHVSLGRAAQHIERGFLPGIGLFSGAAAMAFALRAHSRSGQRYQRAIRDIDDLLTQRLADATENLDRQGGFATAFFDVVSGLAGAVTYAFTTDAAVGPLGEVALRTVDMLAELALVGRPGGLCTPVAKLTDTERNDPAARVGYLNCGFAHGIAGVLNVLGQACDRGWGSTLVAEATECLADVLLSASELDGRLYVPDALPLNDIPVDDRVRSRYAWCYGNLGAAVPFLTSSTLSRRHPDVVARMLDTSHRSVDDLLLDGATLCHGRSGKLVLERIMLGEHTVFDNAASVMELADPGQTFLLGNARGQEHASDSPGFLDGSGGAAAALLSLQTGCEEMDFIRMFTGRWVVGASHARQDVAATTC